MFIDTDEGLLNLDKVRLISIRELLMAYQRKAYAVIIMYDDGSEMELARFDEHSAVKDFFDETIKNYLLTNKLLVLE